MSQNIVGIASKTPIQEWLLAHTTVAATDRPPLSVMTWCSIILHSDTAICAMVLSDNCYSVYNQTGSENWQVSKHFKKNLQ